MSPQWSEQGVMQTLTPAAQQNCTRVLSDLLVLKLAPAAGGQYVPTSMTL